MKTTDLTRDQVEKLLAEVTPMLGYLSRLSARMDKREMGTDRTTQTIPPDYNSGHTCHNQPRGWRAMYGPILTGILIPLVGFSAFFIYLLVVAKKICSGTLTRDPFLPLLPWLRRARITLSLLIAAAFIFWVVEILRSG